MWLNAGARAQQRNSQEPRAEESRAIEHRASSQRTKNRRAGSKNAVRIWFGRRDGTVWMMRLRRSRVARAVQSCIMHVHLHLGICRPCLIASTTNLQLIDVPLRLLYHALDSKMRWTTNFRNARDSATGDTGLMT